MDSTTKPESSILEALFLIRARGSTPRRECVAGAATFMTMAYIIFVNPAILAHAGMPFAAVSAATCIGAALPTLLMGLWGNYPLALASGMGLNAAVAFQATQAGMNWQTMMGVIVIEGIIITVLVFTGTREQIMTILPQNLKHAIAVGIGIFIAFIGLQQMGWVIRGPEGVMLAHGAFHSKPVIVATVGLLLMVLLLARKQPGTILLGILCTTAIAAMSDAMFPQTKSLTFWPKAIFSLPDFSLFGKADLGAAFKPALAGTIFAFLMSDFFDTMGTVIGVADQGGFLDSEGKLARLKRVLLVDSFGAIWGGLCGASSATTYIESAAGVSEGGRTGLTSVVVSLLFLAALFLTPIFGVVPAVATAPALLVVGFLMMRIVREIDFSGVEEGIPAFLMVLLIPLTESISTGIGIGIVTYVSLQVLLGKTRRIPLPLFAIALVFILSFLIG